jgi:hypothetical protein
MMGEVESAASRLCKGGIINDNWGGGSQEETYDVEGTTSAPFEEVEGGGAASIVLEAVEVDVGVLQRS